MPEKQWLEQLAWADQDMTDEDELGLMIDGLLLLYGRDHLEQLAARMGGWANVGIAIGRLVEGWGE